MCMLCLKYTCISIYHSISISICPKSVARLKRPDLHQPCEPLWTWPGDFLVAKHLVHGFFQRNFADICCMLVVSNTEWFSKLSLDVGREHPTSLSLWLQRGWTAISPVQVMLKAPQHWRTVQVEWRKIILHTFPTAKLLEYSRILVGFEVSCAGKIYKKCCKKHLGFPKSTMSYFGTGKPIHLRHPGSLLSGT